MSRVQVCHASGGVATAIAGCGRTLTATDVLFCLLPVGFFLSIVSLV